MLILAALNIAMLLTIWFKTDAFIEYARLLKLTKYNSVLSEFEQVKTNVPSILFVDFLAEQQNTFLSRLLSCPICVSTWLGLLFSLVSSFWLALPSAFLGLALYLGFSRILLNA